MSAPPSLSRERPLVLYYSQSGYFSELMARVTRWPIAARAELLRMDNRTRHPEADLDALVEKYAFLEKARDGLGTAVGAVFLISREKHRIPFAKAYLDQLRGDLEQRGRDPESFPVVFDVIHFATDVPVASDELVDHVLQWPVSDRFDTLTGPGVRPEDSRHDRPLARLLEMASSKPA